MSIAAASCPASEKNLNHALRGVHGRSSIMYRKGDIFESQVGLLEFRRKEARSKWSECSRNKPLFYQNAVIPQKMRRFDVTHASIRSHPLWNSKNYHMYFSRSSNISPCSYPVNHRVCEGTVEGFRRKQIFMQFAQSLGLPHVKRLGDSSLPQCHVGQRA